MHNGVHHDEYGQPCGYEVVVIDGSEYYVINGEYVPVSDLDDAGQDYEMF